MAKAPFWKEYLQRWITSDLLESSVLVTGSGVTQAVGEIVGGSVVPLSDIEVVEFDDEGKTISIESLRKLFASIGTTSHVGKRLVVLRGVERLSLPASHALLKTLEEPSKTNRLLLVTDFPNRLLETILSRVQVLRIQGERVVSEKALPSNWQDQWKMKLMKKSKNPLEEGELAEISSGLSALARTQPNPTVTRALLRLRDYYKISTRGGNEKLAADVLLACLAEIKRTP